MNNLLKVQKIQAEVRELSARLVSGEITPVFEPIEDILYPNGIIWKGALVRTYHDGERLQLLNEVTDA